MATKAQFIALYREHPDWTARQFAEAMGCAVNAVCVRASQCKIKLHKPVRAATPEVLRARANGMIRAGIAMHRRAAEMEAGR